MTPLAIDSSSLIGYLNGHTRADTNAVHDALAGGRAVLPPLVVAEVLSLPSVTAEIARLVGGLVQLPVIDGYWERAGRLRARVLADGRRARMADALIAQSCIDHDVALVSHDADFRHFAMHGLTLLD